jgi:DNA-nicking Smr family endonuclease
MVRKRTLTEEEKLLWKHVTRNDTPLVMAAIEEEMPEQKKTEAIKIKTEITKNTSVKNIQKHQPLKDKGNYAGIDKNTASRFKRGEAPIDATLDLHGMTQAKAHNAFESFIQKHISQNSRRLLVITGKGSGILQQALPKWMNSPDISGQILAYDEAKAKHGGSGAYYILLKRKRK